MNLDWVKVLLLLIILVIVLFAVSGCAHSTETESNAGLRARWCLGFCGLIDAETSVKTKTQVEHKEAPKK